MNQMRSQASISVLVVLVVAALACSSSESQPTVTMTSVPAATPTSTSEPTPASVEEAVLRDYANYWTVYSAALHDLDSTRLSDVMTGPRLERALDEVATLRREGRAVKIQVENEPVVVQVEGDTAMVLDNYQNRSHFIDPSTKESLTNPSGFETIRDSVTLVRVGDTWRVLDTFRNEVTP